MNAELKYSRPVKVDIAVYAWDLSLAMAVTCLGGGYDGNLETAVKARSRQIELEYLNLGPPLLLACVDGMFFWRQDAALDQLPDFSVSPLPPLMPGHSGPVNWVGLKHHIHYWLFGLAVGFRKPDPCSEADQFLLKSGLYEKLRHGEVRELDRE